MSGVAGVRPVPEEEVAGLLEPWLGEHAAEADLPVPAMIEVEMASEGGAQLASFEATVRRVAPSALVSDVAEWLTPLSGLLTSLQWLAIGLVALMIAATGATVVLAARASLNTHNATIEILHLMGATDHQIARLFQQRISMDVLFGGRVAAIGSELLGAAALPEHGWTLLVLLPLAGALLALLVARVTIIRALGRLL